MDYALLTAVHPRKSAPVKMDAKQEQEYYDRAAHSLEPLEEAHALITRARRLGGALAALIQTMRGNFGPGHDFPQSVTLTPR